MTRKITTTGIVLETHQTPNGAFFIIYRRGTFDIFGGRSVIEAYRKMHRWENPNPSYSFGSL